MCLIAIAWRARPDLPLVVAANRDEWRDRPAQPAGWWADRPGILAGRDLQAGGTWLGISRDGRFAAVTNFRDPSERRSTARSRGELVADFLAGTETPADYVERIAARAREYNAFNLLVADTATLWYFGSREGAPRPVEPGVHAISNHVLDEPWPKVMHARQAMESAIATADPAAPLFEMLSDATPAVDEHLPRTGVPIEWERRLSPALIMGDDYGTRNSTVVVRHADGATSLEEWTRNGAGGVVLVSRDAEVRRVPQPVTPR
ncbi:MAG TPA: NRDE family protein [Usitatibacter sp.]|nr:NRDE family protein [Usitatibacter sp.]